ncbi:sensor histidine kinase [Mucilaginibacter glaciei]|uniref:histidine kinase n=1 Tax=Mucilaginibacter glaciei TaxID=2772109 RepID=A0A926NYW9_9SPHI|nr:PAS domain-containing sensor histidine kinase [Mucilaginibacter glaciei]MBD1394219.1 PAS domain-containing sensor histidine kinase [Mucilaginibacter glaciei]
MNYTLISDEEAMLAIIRQLPGNYLILLPDAPRFTIVEVSGQYNLTTLTKREDIIGKGVFEVFSDNPNDPDADGVKNLSASLQAVIETGESQEMHVQKWAVATPGTTEFTDKYWLPVNKPVIIGGKTAYIIHAVLDMTENQLLKLSEQYFKGLADESPFMIWRSVAGSCKYVNKAWSDFTGLSLEASLGSGHLQAFHPDDIATQRDLFYEAMLAKTAYETKYRLLRNDGETRWVMMKASPHLFDGYTTEYIGSIIDVTEQEIAKQSIEESEKQFRQMADSIIQMIWITDAKGQHEYYNQRWYDFTGTNFDHTGGDGWNQMFHPDDQAKARNRWQHSLDTGEPYEIEYRLRKFTGEYVWVLGRAAPFLDQYGTIIKWFGTCTDIHDQKLLQQQKDEFISIASHELKTPLTSLTANLQFLQRVVKSDNQPNAVIDKMLNSANNNAKKLNSLITNLLNVTSIEQGQLNLNKTKFRIGKLIEDCSEYLLTGKHTIKVCGNDAIEIEADEAKLEQVLVNLINNAVKYAPESKEIELDLAEGDHYLKVSVSDKGSGISADQLPHVFDRYYRAGHTEKHPSGMGLGLYICADIIKRHRGEIGVDSTVGRGSTFWFTIPLN